MLSVVAAHAEDASDGESRCGGGPKYGDGCLLDNDACHETVFWMDYYKVTKYAADWDSDLGIWELTNPA